MVTSSQNPNQKGIILRQKPLVVISGTEKRIFEKNVRLWLGKANKRHPPNANPDTSAHANPDDIWQAEKGQLLELCDQGVLTKWATSAGLTIPTEARSLKPNSYCFCQDPYFRPFF